MALTGLGSACGPNVYPNGVWPGPKGEVLVALYAHEGSAVAAACYDALWVEKRGPRDCADLVPPWAPLQPVAGGAARRPTDRGPTTCAGAPAVRLPLDGPAEGWYLYTEGQPETAPRLDGGTLVVDLDADGEVERLSPLACL